MDPWFPFGKGDILTAAQLALFLCHMSGYEEINDFLDPITTNAAKALRIQDRYGIAEGKRADFLVLDALHPPLNHYVASLLVCTSLSADAKWHIRYRRRMW